MKNIINSHSQHLVEVWKQLYTALILVVALAWNEAIKSLFDFRLNRRNP